MEPVAPFVTNILFVGENGGSGPDRRGGRQQFMNRRGQHRIMGQPVAERLNCTLQCGNAPIPRGYHFGPSGETTGKFIRPGHLGGWKVRASGRFTQGGNQGRLGSLRQHRRLHVQNTCYVEQKFSSDSATVVLDQVKIGW